MITGKILVTLPKFFSHFRVLYSAWGYQLPHLLWIYCELQSSSLRAHFLQLLPHWMSFKKEGKHLYNRVTKTNRIVQYAEKTLGSRRSRRIRWLIRRSRLPFTTEEISRSIRGSLRGSRLALSSIKNGRISMSCTKRIELWRWETRLMCETLSTFGASGKLSWRFPLRTEFHCSIFTTK
jgi:hypothetical protein